jgi:hypothetical protein
MIIHIYRDTTPKAQENQKYEYLNFHNIKLNFFHIMSRLLKLDSSQICQA